MICTKNDTAWTPDTVESSKLLVFNPTYSNLIILRKNSSLMVFYMMKVFHVKNRFLIVFYVMKVFHVKSFSNFTRRLPALYYYLSHKKSVSMFLHQRFLLKVA